MISPAQMTMPARTVSKCCARTRSECPDIFFLDLISCRISGIIEPWSECLPEIIEAFRKTSPPPPDQRNARSPTYLGLPRPANWPRSHPTAKIIKVPWQKLRAILICDCTVHPQHWLRKHRFKKASPSPGTNIYIHTYIHTYIHIHIYTYTSQTP